jgi:tRNA(Phe) wybutosine-synthesizing methylase Tyw3
MNKEDFDKRVSTLTLTNAELLKAEQDNEIIEILNKINNYRERI